MPKVYAPKVIICGRVASGKSLLADLLEDKGLTVAESYTTRPPRFENETGHIFISREIAEKMKSENPDDICLETEHNGYDYFMTRDEIYNSDIIILDKKGIDEITARFPELAFRIILVRGLDEEKRKTAFIQRSSETDKIRLDEEFERRRTEEDDDFTEFEYYLTAKPSCMGYANVYMASLVNNNYNSDSDIFSMSDIIFNQILQAKRIAPIINDILDAEKLNTILEEIGVTYDRENNVLRSEINVEIPISHLTEYTLNEPALFFFFISTWLCDNRHLDIYNIN